MAKKGSRAPATARKRLLFNFLLGAVIGALLSVGYFRPKISVTEEKAVCFGPSRQVDLARNVETIHEIREEDGFRFINPLLECEVGNEIENNDLVPAKDHVMEHVDQALQADLASRISVYYRDLNNGPWFGINEDEEYLPGSLIKVPVLMALLKQYELKPALLELEIEYVQESDEPKNPFPPDYYPPNKLRDGEFYAVEELIYRSIAYSDNDSYFALLNITDDAWMRKIHKDLDFIYPEDEETEILVNAKDFSQIFRVLFNASYLPRAISEDALGLFSATTFGKGIRQGVPMGTTVAAKFGIKVNPDTSEYVLHDCGIVYYPGQPYLLCVMTEGAEFADLEMVIGDISKAVYDDVAQVPHADH